MKRVASFFATCLLMLRSLAFGDKGECLSSLAYSKRAHPDLAAMKALARDLGRVIDLICPFAKGGKVGLFGGAGVGKTSSECSVRML